MSDPVKRSENTIMILALTPIIVAAFVLGGLFLGFYLADALGFSKLITGVVLSTAGLFASLPVVVKFVGWMISKETKRTSSQN